MNRVIFLLISVIIIMVGCSSKNNSQFISPQNYYSEAELNVLSENSQNKYNLKMYHSLDKYKIIINNGTAQWDITYDGVNCKMSNTKFENSPILLRNMKLLDELICEVDLSKFDGLTYKNCKDIRYCVNDLRYVLQLDEESYYPKVISVYRDNQLIKKINYTLFDTDNYDAIYNITDDIVVY